jgi:streptomycin 6-kinase
MSGFELSSNLRRAVDEQDVSGSIPRAWLASLPFVVEEVARLWSLDVGRPFQPGGSASWVAPVRGAAGEHLVLKVGWLHEEAAHEADALRIWDGAGAVRLVDAMVAGQSNAMLLEACEPGHTLSEVRPPQAQDAVVAGLLRRLWITPSADHPFRTLQSMCDRWADQFEERYANADPQFRLDRGLAMAGIELFRSLPGTAGVTVLLCTDLHPENVLSARREPWLVIDPKPYVGDPTYDCLQHMLNHPDRLSADPAALAQRMADLLDLDVQRLRLWLFARCVQESLDEPDLQLVATDLAP